VALHVSEQVGWSGYGSKLDFLSGAGVEVPIIGRPVWQFGTTSTESMQRGRRSRGDRTECPVQRNQIQDKVQMSDRFTSCSW